MGARDLDALFFRGARPRCRGGLRSGCCGGDLAGGWVSRAWGGDGLARGIGGLFGKGVLAVLERLGALCERLQSLAVELRDDHRDVVVTAGEVRAIGERLA